MYLAPVLGCLCQTEMKVNDAVVQGDLSAPQAFEIVLLCPNDSEGSHSLSVS